MNAALFAEYEAVLQQATLFEGCRLSAAARDELLDIFMSHCIWTRVYYLWRPNLPDEGDNHLIELAVAGGSPCGHQKPARFAAHGIAFSGASNRVA